MANERKFSLIITAKDKTRAVFSHVRKGLSGLGDVVRKVFSPTGLLVGGLGAFGLGALGKSFLDTASSFENLEASLTTTLGSLEKAREAIKYANDEAAASPYTVMEYGEAIRTLSAYGIQYRDVMRTLGDTAAAMNKPLSQAVEALADAIQGEGERLKEFGIKQNIAGDQITYTWTDALGKVRKTIAENNPKIIQETLKAIWNEKYQGGMEKFGKTWSGLTSTAKSLWDEFKLAVMESGAFDLLKTALQNIIAKIQEAKKTGDFKRWAEETGQAVMKVARTVLTLIPQILLVILQIVQKISLGFRGWGLLWQEVTYHAMGFSAFMQRVLQVIADGVIMILKLVDALRIFDTDSLVGQLEGFSGNQDLIISQLERDRSEILKNQQNSIAAMDKEQAEIEGYKAKIGELEKTFTDVITAAEKTVAAQKQLGEGTREGVDKSISELDRYIAKCREAKAAAAAIPTDFRGSNYGGSVGDLEASITHAEKTE